MTQSIALLILGSVAAGAVTGAFYGFCIAAHSAAVGGYSFSNRNKLFRFLTAVNPSLSIAQAAVILLTLGCSVCLFFGAFMVPAALATWLLLPDGLPILASYAALLISAYFGRQFGAHVCRVIA